MIVDLPQGLYNFVQVSFCISHICEMFRYLITLFLFAGEYQYRFFVDGDWKHMANDVCKKSYKTLTSSLQ